MEIKEVAHQKRETPASTGNREPIHWTKSTCPYCGIGCALEVGVENGKVVKAHGMKGHPINNGKICHLAETFPHVFDASGRLTRHMIRYDGGLVPVTLKEAIMHIATELRRIIESHGPNAVAFHGGAANPVYDDFSKQPELNFSAVSVSKTAPDR